MTTVPERLIEKVRVVVKGVFMVPGVVVVVIAFTIIYDNRKYNSDYRMKYLR